MGGYEAARTIRRADIPRAKTVSVIAITADAFPHDAKATLDAGMASGQTHRYGTPETGDSDADLSLEGAFT